MEDSALSCTTKGTAVCKFTVACNSFFKQGEETQKKVSCFDVSRRANTNAAFSLDSEDVALVLDRPCTGL